MTRDQMLPTRGDHLILLALENARSDAVVHLMDAGYWHGYYAAMVNVAGSHLDADPALRDKAREEIRQLFSKEVA